MLQKLLVYLLSNYIPGQRFLVTATESLSGKSEFIHTEERWLLTIKAEMKPDAVIHVRHERHVQSHLLEA